MPEDGRGLLARLAAGPVLLDGAMGTLLRAAGWPAGRPVELASVEAPDLVRDAHRAYRRAGAAVLTATTFGAHGGRLDALALGGRLEELCAAALARAREAACDEAWVAASIGPPGEPIYPLGDRSFREAVDGYRRQVAACRAGGADLFVLESFTDLLDLQAAMIAAGEAGARPLAVSMALRPEALAAGLVSPEALADVAQALGADLVGLNCMPPPQTAALVGRLLARARVPVLAMPSAGTPSAEGGYPVGPDDFAGWAEGLRAAGVRALGGCCGTTPEHVEAVGRVLSRWPAGGAAAAPGSP
jgi:5-methyltetrahydrofolate--homocysteine methyltransferase